MLSPHRRGMGRNIFFAFVVMTFHAALFLHYPCTGGHQLGLVNIPDLLRGLGFKQRELIGVVDRPSVLFHCLSFFLVLHKPDFSSPRGLRPDRHC